MVEFVLDSRERQPRSWTRRRPQVLVLGAEAERFAVLLRSLPPMPLYAQAARIGELTTVTAESVVLVTEEPVRELRRLLALPGAGRILVLSRVRQEREVVAALRIGALGYLVHGEFDRRDLGLAVAKLRSGQASLSRSAADAVVSNLQCRRSVGDLRPRQQEMLRLAALGETNAQIAARVGLKEKTIRNQMSEIYSALDVSSRTAAVRYWLDR